MKKINIGIIIFILLAITISVFFALPKIKELKIESEIKKANYCNVNSDCVNAGGKCPFGCWVYVNKNEVARVSELINSFDSNCVYGCVSCPTAVCENKKCQAVCE